MPRNSLANVEKDEKVTDSYSGKAIPDSNMYMKDLFSPHTGGTARKEKRGREQSLKKIWGASSSV